MIMNKLLEKIEEIKNENQYLMNKLDFVKNPVIAGFLTSIASLILIYLQLH